MMSDKNTSKIAKMDSYFEDDKHIHFESVSYKKYNKNKENLNNYKKKIVRPYVTLPNKNIEKKVVINNMQSDNEKESLKKLVWKILLNETDIPLSFLEISLIQDNINTSIFNGLFSNRFPDVFTEDDIIKCEQIINNGKIEALQKCKDLESILKKPIVHTRFKQSYLNYLLSPIDYKPIERIEYEPLFRKVKK